MANRLKPKILSTKRSRSVSPNNVIINGQIIDKNWNDELALSKISFQQNSFLLDNIMEKDVVVKRSDMSEDDISLPLNDAVKIADENVQRFLQQIVPNDRESNIEMLEEDLRQVCTRNQEEMTGLGNLFSSIDDESKNKIVNSLLNVYKKGILSSLDTSNQGQVRKNSAKISASKDPQNRTNASKNFLGDYGKNLTVTYVIEDCKEKLGNVQNMGEHKTSTDPCNISEEKEKNQHLDRICKEVSDDLFKNKEKAHQEDQEVKGKNVPGGEFNLNLNDDLIDYYHTKYNFKEKSSPRLGKRHSVSSKNKKMSLRDKAKNDFPDVSIDQSKENDIRKIIDREKKIHADDRNDEYSKYKGLPDSYYEEVKKLTEEFDFDCFKFKSEGVQASNGPFKLWPSKSSFSVMKPFKYHSEYLNESKSEVALQCPFGHHLKPKHSKSETNITCLNVNTNNGQQHRIYRTKHRSKLTKNIPKEKSRSIITLEAKESVPLLNGPRRGKNKMINFLEDDLKRGDSEHEYSQVLFETAAKNIDNDTSTVVVPLLEENHVNTFNANYLLHTIEIQKKSEIMPAPNLLKQYYHDVSNPTITEEDYKIWLKKQNWMKYSNKIKDMQSLEDLKSVSQITPSPIETPRRPTIVNEVRYYLERGDNITHSTTSVANLISDLGEAFLYEHAVISRVMNFFWTLNIERTKIITRQDRMVQLLFLALFYSIFAYLNNYVFIENKPKTMWKY